MTQEIPNKVILVFDPGALTGFAALGDDGTIIFTSAFDISTLENFLKIAALIGYETEVIIEVGPQWQHNSPVTKIAESQIVEVFPNAHHVPPAHWKSHPASKKFPRPINMTKHEHDAVCLGLWFLATRGTYETERTHTNTIGTDPKRSRHKCDRKGHI